jgi:predicted nucleic acid-binding protein
MIIVLDTNVLVAALISPFGAPARVLDLILAGEARLACDDRTLAEYRQVLARPKWQFPPQGVADLLAYLAAEAEPVVALPLPAILPDPADLPFLEVAVQAGAPLVTGNRRHFPEGAWQGLRVFSSAEFLAFLGSSQAQERG